MREIIESIAQLIRTITAFVLWIWDIAQRLVLWLIELWDTIGLIVFWTKWCMLAATLFIIATAVARFIKSRRTDDGDSIDPGV